MDAYHQWSKAHDYDVVLGATSRIERPDGYVEFRREGTLIVNGQQRFGQFQVGGKFEQVGPISVLRVEHRFFQENRPKRRVPEP
jgi:hypothetical protein